MFGERLKLARKKAGLSQDKLVDVLNRVVTKQSLSKYERGKMMPGSKVLGALARALDVSMEYLLSDEVLDLEGVDFRKKSRTSARDRAMVEAAVIQQMERYLAIEEVLGLDSTAWRLPALKHAEVLVPEEVERLAAELRRLWKLGNDPIPDMTELLEAMGLKVLILDLPDNVDGLTCFVVRKRSNQRLPVIVINQNKTLERRRLTLAHELLHRIVKMVGDYDEEKAAQHFAGAFLIPADHLKREIGDRRRSLSYQELTELKRFYRVSGAALLMRLKQAGIIDESTLSTAFQTVARSWRTNEPLPLEEKGMEGSQEKPERFDRLCYRALAEGYISTAKAMELLQQSLAEIEQAIKGPGQPHADYR